MRRIAVAVLTAVTFAVSLLAAGPAIADPSQPPPLGTVPSQCVGLGEVLVVASHGNSLWIGTQHYVLESITIGGETSSFGARTGLGERISCRSLTGSGITITLAAVPGP